MIKRFLYKSLVTIYDYSYSRYIQRWKDNEIL